MRSVALLPLLLAASANAQNWALLNPAYRYNFSNDGTDTISNQVFITHVDTLGPDSFRYELNGVAEVCDTCQGPELHLWTDRPQFLQGAVNMGPLVWHFQDPGSLVIQPHAGVGASWLFDTIAGVTANVLLVDTVQLFGNDVERKWIGLSDGGSLSISPDRGILTWNMHTLIGVHGPDEGILVPTLRQMLPYGSDDVVEYAVGNAQTDGVSSEYGDRRLYKFTVDTGAVVEGTMVFSGAMIDHRYEWTNSWLGGTTVTFGHQNILGTTWIAGRPEFPWADLLLSYPGQVIGHRSELLGDSLICIAEHGWDPSGRYTLGCRAVQDPGNQIGHFMSMTTALPGEPLTCQIRNYCSGGIGAECGVVYTAGTGLNWYRGDYFEANEEYILVGSVVDGDTTGTVDPDDHLLTLNVDPNDRPVLELFPSPASDHFTMMNAPAGAVVRMMDGMGQLVRIQLIRSNEESIDVTALAPGMYVLSGDGMRPQRMLIAR